MLDPQSQRDDPPSPAPASPAQGQDPDAPISGRIRAFLSYSRANEGEADRLASALEEGGIQVSLDRSDIVPGEDWRERLAGLILGCEVFVFAISPSSVASPVCDWEINEAERLSKRIFPVLLVDTPVVDIPGRLRRLQIVVMSSPDEWATNLARLLDGVRVDASWTREHTRLLERAESWKRSGRRSGWLGGRELAEAEIWLSKRPASSQMPTALHLKYIQTSRRAIVRRRVLLAAAGVFGVLAIAAILVLRNVAEVRAASSALLDSATRATALVNSPRQREGLVTALSAGRRSEQLFGRIIPGVLSPLLDALARAREVLRVDDPGRQPRDMRVSDDGEVLLLYRRDGDDVGASELIGATWTLGATPVRAEIKADRLSDAVALCPRGSCYLVGKGERMAVLDPHGNTLWPDIEKATSLAADLDPGAAVLYRVTASGSLVRRGWGDHEQDEVLRTGFLEAETVQVSRNGRSVLVLDKECDLPGRRENRWPPVRWRVRPDRVPAGREARRRDRLA